MLIELLILEISHRILIMVPGLGGGISLKIIPDAKIPKETVRVADATIPNRAIC